MILKQRNTPHMKRAQHTNLLSVASVAVMAAVLACTGLSSCVREILPVAGNVPDLAGKGISEASVRRSGIAAADSLVRFGASEVPFYGVEVTTKTAEVTSLTSFYASVTTPGNNYDQQIYTNKVFTLVNGDFVSDLFWPAEGITWQFDCANTPLTWTSDGFEVEVDNDFDLLVARELYPQKKVKNTLVFEHAFARIDDVVITAATGWTLSGVTLYITPVVSGTYNLKQGYGKTDGTGWSWSAPEDLGSEINIAPSGAGTSHPGLLLVPGTYLVRAGWTASDGVNPSVSFSDMVMDVTIVGGKNNVISITLGGTL